MVVRAFVQLRQMLASNAELSRKLVALEKNYDIKFNPDSSLAIGALQNQWVVDRVLTRHVGLKHDLRSNGLSGFKAIFEAIH